MYFHIYGDIGIDKSKAHSKQYEGNCVDKNVIVRKIQIQIIYDILLLFGKMKHHANCGQVKHHIPICHSQVKIFYQSDSSQHLSVAIYIYSTDLKIEQTNHVHSCNYWLQHQAKETLL